MPLITFGGKNSRKKMANTPQKNQENAILNNKSLDIKNSSYFNEPVLTYNRIVKDDNYLVLELISIIKRIFNNIFEYQVLENNKNNDNIKNIRDFTVKMEEILFENGQCAVVKIFNNFYPASFSCNDEDLDYFGNPKKILVDLKIKDGDDFSVKTLEIKDTDFVIIKNNSLKRPTIFGLLGRIKEVATSIIDNDYASMVSQPHIFYKTAANDGAIQDVHLALNNNSPVSAIRSDWTDKIEIFAPPDVTPSRQQQVIFQINLLMKMLGFNTADLAQKQQRQTEFEIAISNNWSDLLKDMWIQRKIGLKDLEDLGLKIEMPDEFSEETKKPEADPNLQGEENKKSFGDFSNKKSEKNEKDKEGDDNDDNS